MRSRSVTVAVIVSVVAVLGAVGCYLRAAELRRQGLWLLERANAQATEYAMTFDGAVAESQLKTFEERRELLDRAHLWQRGQMLLILLAVIAAFSTYVLFLLRRLSDDLQDVASDAPAASQEPAAYGDPLTARR